MTDAAGDGSAGQDADKAEMPHYQVSCETCREWGVASERNGFDLQKTYRWNDAAKRSRRLTATAVPSRHGPTELLGWKRVRTLAGIDPCCLPTTRQGGAIEFLPRQRRYGCIGAETPESSPQSTTTLLGQERHVTLDGTTMAITYTWGRWEEEWPNGRFRCVFVESSPQPDGMIHATGLYHAVNGDTLYDIDTFRDAIVDRAAIIADDCGEVLVKAEFAELLTHAGLWKS